MLVINWSSICEVVCHAGFNSTMNGHSHMWNVQMESLLKTEEVQGKDTWLTETQWWELKENSGTKWEKHTAQQRQRQELSGESWRDAAKAWRGGCKAQKPCFQEELGCADRHVTHFMWDSSAFTQKRPDSKRFPGSSVTKRQTNRSGKLPLAAAEHRDPRAEAPGSAETGKEWTL